MNARNASGGMSRPMPACVGEDPELFFDPHAGATVARICASCPVTSCLADALEREERHGWWQSVYLGTDLDDPMVIAEPTTIRPTIPSRHGSRGRYSMGCRCDECTEANRLYAQHYRHDGPAVTRAAEINPFEQLTIGAST